jgi:hypothetical protein
MAAITLYQERITNPLRFYYKIFKKVDKGNLKNTA